MFPIRKITTMNADVFRDEYSLAFDGTNDRLEISSNFESTVFNSAFSIALWVKLDDGRPSATEYLFGTKDGNDSIWGRVETDGDIQLFYKEGSAEEALVASGYFADGATQWTHLVFVISDSAQAIYANGVLIASNTTSLDTSGFAQDTNRNFIIGARNNAGTVEDGIAGKISDCALYTKALSAAEVRTLYNGREAYNHKEGSIAKNLYSWWRMGDGFLDEYLNNQGLISDEVNPTIGSNIIADGAFTTAVGESTSGTHWITEAGWTISGGSATYDGGGDSNTQLESVTNSSLVDNAVHRVDFTLTDTGGGGVYVRICGGSFTLVTGTGTKRVYSMAGTGTNRLTFETGHDDKAFTIDDVRVYRVNGKAGVMKNMDATDIEPDTQSPR